MLRPAQIDEDGNEEKENQEFGTVFNMPDHNYVKKDFE